eukprot:630899-Pelagomonas_calceolata.AAC.1
MSSIASSLIKACLVLSAWGTTWSSPHLTNLKFAFPDDIKNTQLQRTHLHICVQGSNTAPPIQGGKTITPPRNLGFCTGAQQHSLLNNCHSYKLLIQIKITSLNSCFCAGAHQSLLHTSSGVPRVLGTGAERKPARKKGSGKSCKASGETGIKESARSHNGHFSTSPCIL